MATDSEKAQLRTLIAHLQRTREAECNEIIRVMHDELLSRLVRINLDLGVLRRGERSEARTWASAAQRLAEAIRIVAKLRTELRPALMEHCGLEAAMRWTASEWSKRHRLRCDFTASPNAPRFVPALALELFRLYQDGLSGLTQTCRPAHLSIHLATGKTTHGLTLRARALAANGFQELMASADVFAVRERVRRLGGKLVVRETPAPTIKVAITVPVQS